MKIYVKKYFKFINFKNLFCAFCLITFISCASNTKLDELQNPEILEQNEQENLNSKDLNSADEKLDEDLENNLSESQENQNSLSNQEYPEIEILTEEPNVFDEVIQDKSENQNIQELDSDINPYFESEENNLNNSNIETEILTESEELPKDISEFYSQENESQEPDNSIEENQENSQTLTDKIDETNKTQEVSENPEILVPENQENQQNTENFEEDNSNQNLNSGLQEVPTVEEINSFSETNLAQENLDDEDKFNDEQTEIPIASRSLTMKQNQFLEVHYPGSGWIYLGEEDSKNLMRYMGRKIGTSDTIFTLRSRSQGTSLLHFYKNDALTGNFIDDYLEVQIKGKATDSEIAIAPSYEEIVPKRFNSASSAQVENSSIQEASSSSQSASSSTSSDNSLSQSENSSSQEESSTLTENSLNQSSANSPEEILELAKDSYNNKNYSQSLNYVNEFLSVSNTKLDEALFLKGQILEATSEVQNIKEALNAYESLVKSYPKSSYWKRASERTTYIKRFYFNIR